MIAMTALTAEQKIQFESIAHRLGHDVRELGHGRPQESEILVTTIDHMRNIMCHADEATRKQRQKAFFDNIASRQSRIEGYHDRAHAFVFADGTLTDEDRAHIHRNFPMRMRTLSLEDKTLAPGEVWNLGVHESPVVVNLGTLTMGPGSKVVIYNSVLTFTCQNLIKQAPSAAAHTALAGNPHFASLAENYDFGVFGLNWDEWVRFTLPEADWVSVLNAGIVTPDLAKQFAAAEYGVTTGTPITTVSQGAGWRIVDSVLMVTYSLVVDPLNTTSINVYQVAMQGGTGAAGKQPGQAPNGTCKCSNTEPGHDGKDGYHGGNGANGNTGSQAPDGMPNLLAEISINNLTGVLAIATKGGDGSQGGRGGTGGAGSKGGKGGYGTKCSATCDNGGDGGTGGTGGDGGQGGKGGFHFGLLSNRPGLAFDSRRKPRRA
jgi:hypothetical protein